jgi:plastocyanin
MQRREFLWSSTLGAASGAASGSALAQESTPTETPDGATGTATGTGTGTATGTPAGSAGGGGGGTTHTVDMNDALAYVPEEITVAPGDTVVWENVGSVGHTVTAYQDEIPEDAEYFASGGFESEDAARSDIGAGNVPGGESYSHTFEVTGTYEYVCLPHEGAGMVGTVVVQEGGGQQAGGGGGEQDPHEMGVPFQAHYVGIATLLAILITLVFTFFVLKYGESPHASGRND